MSPFCPGLTVEECPSSQAEELRGRISQEVAAGLTNEQIDDWLIANYGEKVLARPREVASWLVPLALFAAAGLMMLFRIPSRSTRDKSGLGATDVEIGQNQNQSTPNEMARLERDLASFKEATE
jgi:cytochrome c-type biogenesis protein CcmH/NrfF